MKTFNEYYADNVNEGFKDVLAAGLLGGSALLPQNANAIQHPAHHHHIKPSITKSSIHKPLTKSSVHKKTPTQTISAADAAAKTIWAEARGEGNKGMYAVATVIDNRAKHNPNNVVKVVQKKNKVHGKWIYQFSSWEKGTPVVIIKNEEDKKNWEYCKLLGKAIANGTFEPSASYNHFYEPSKANPSWAHGQQYTPLGNHRFYTL